MGREAKFDIDLCNTGTDPAENTCVTATLPEGLEFVSASNGSAHDPQTRQVRGRSARWRRNSIAA